MVLTLNAIFSDPEIIQAVIDRTVATEQDPIYWQRYLEFEQTNSRTFKTYIGTSTGVVMGSIIDRNSTKPIRERRALGSGFGEVATLGDSYQMDNDRLDLLRRLTYRFNARGANQAVVLDEIVNFLVDDIRQLTLAPHKRMDYVVGQLRSTGKAEVKVDENRKGVELIDINLPVKHLKPEGAVKDSLIAYLQEVIAEMRPTVGTFGAIEMTRKTFNEVLLKSAEFKNTYKSLYGNAEFAMAGGLLTDSMVNQLIVGLGLPAIRLVEEFVTKEDGTVVNAFADGKISLLPSGSLGKMKWHTPYEITDPVPNKIYTPLAGGHFISAVRTDEGRFTEYMAEWLPDFANPNKIAIVDLENVIGALE